MKDPILFFFDGGGDQKKKVSKIKKYFLKN